MAGNILALNASFKRRKLARADLPPGWRCAIYVAMRADEKNRADGAARQVDERSVALGAAVRAARKAKGQTLVDLADALGISEGQMSKLERGISDIDWPQLTTIADHLGMLPSALAAMAERNVAAHVAQLHALVDDMPEEQARSLLEFLSRSNEPRSGA